MNAGFFENEVSRYIRKALTEIPKNEREVIYLYFFKGFKMFEIGKITSRTESRISQIVSKALLRLRASLHRFYLTGFADEPPRHEHHILPSEIFKQLTLMPDLSKTRHFDLIGKSFGHWTLIEFLGHKNKHEYWLCRCRCGREARLGRYFLETGIAAKECVRCRKKKRRHLGPKKKPGQTDSLQPPFSPQIDAGQDPCAPSVGDGGQFLPATLPYAKNDICGNTVL